MRIQEQIVVDHELRERLSNIDSYTGILYCKVSPDLLKQYLSDKEQERGLLNYPPLEVAGHDTST